MDLASVQVGVSSLLKQKWKINNFHSFLFVFFVCFSIETRPHPIESFFLLLSSFFKKKINKKKNKKKKDGRPVDVIDVGGIFFH